MGEISSRARGQSHVSRLDDDRARHVRVQGTEIRIFSSFGENEREPVAGVEHLRFEGAVVGGDRVRDVVVEAAQAADFDALLRGAA